MAAEKFHAPKELSPIEIKKIKETVTSIEDRAKIFFSVSPSNIPSFFSAKQEIETYEKLEQDIQGTIADISSLPKIFKEISNFPPVSLFEIYSFLAWDKLNDLKRKLESKKEEKKEVIIISTEEKSKIEKFLKALPHYIAQYYPSASVFEYLLYTIADHDFTLTSNILLQATVEKDLNSYSRIFCFDLLCIFSLEAFFKGDFVRLVQLKNMAAEISKNEIGAYREIISKKSFKRNRVTEREVEEDIKEWQEFLLRAFSYFQYEINKIFIRVKKDHQEIHSYTSLCLFENRLKLGKELIGAQTELNELIEWIKGQYPEQKGEKATATLEDIILYNVEQVSGIIKENTTIIKKYEAGIAEYRKKVEGELCSTDSTRGTEKGKKLISFRFKAIHEKKKEEEEKEEEKREEKTAAALSEEERIQLGFNKSLNDNYEELFNDFIFKKDIGSRLKKVVEEISKRTLSEAISKETTKEYKRLQISAVVLCLEFIMQHFKAEYKSTKEQNNSLPFQQTTKLLKEYLSKETKRDRLKAISNHITPRLKIISMIIEFMPTWQEALTQMRKSLKEFKETKDFSNEEEIFLQGLLNESMSNYERFHLFVMTEKEDIRAFMEKKKGILEKAGKYGKDSTPKKQEEVSPEAHLRKLLDAFEENSSRLFEFSEEKEEETSQMSAFSFNPGSRSQQKENLSRQKDSGRAV